MSEIEKLLRELLAVERANLVELRGLRGDLRRAVSPPAGEIETNLIREIAAACGARAFVSSELIGAAAVRPSLRIAIEAFGEIDARRLGKVLQRIEGRDCDGLSVVRAGDSGGGAIWVLKGSRGSDSLDSHRVHSGLKTAAR
jgi:hypothetical protein